MQTSEAAKALFSLWQVLPFGRKQLKSKLYLAQHTSCDLVCCNHLPNATESKAEKPKVEKQETAILIFFRGLQKVAPSKLAPVFGTKRISSRNIFWSPFSLSHNDINAF